MVAVRTRIRHHHGGLIFMPPAPTNWQLFTARQMNETGNAYTAFYVPEQDGAPAALTTCSVTAQASGPVISVAFTPTPLGANLAILLALLIPASSSVPPDKNPFRLLAISAKNPTSPWNPYAPFASWLGTMTTGQTLHCLARTWDVVKNHLGPPSLLDITIT